MIFRNFYLVTLQTAHARHLRCSILTRRVAKQSYFRNITEQRVKLCKAFVHNDRVLKMKTLIVFRWVCAVDQKKKVIRVEYDGRVE